MAKRRKKRAKKVLGRKKSEWMAEDLEEQERREIAEQKHFPEIDTELRQRHRIIERNFEALVKQQAAVSTFFGM